MRFSVIIPIHNKLPHLDRSINSVINQSFGDFEILLIDDASTDGSADKIKEFKDSRIKILTRTEPGPGGYAARNYGIDNAQGDWIAFLDADDEWYPNHLEKMNQLAILYPDVAFMSCGWEKKRGDNKKINAYYRKNKEYNNKYISVNEYLKNGLNKQLPVWTSVAIVKRDSPITEKFFPAGMSAKRGGDLHAWLKMICFHKQMAWSNHIGAIYHMDSVNMVTKQAKFSIELMDRATVKKTAFNLEKDDEKLLYKYLNQRLKKALIASKIQSTQITGFLKAIHWKSNFKSALLLYISYFIPVYFFKIIKK